MDTSNRSMCTWVACGHMCGKHGVGSAGRKSLRRTDCPVSLRATMDLREPCKAQAIAPFGRAARPVARSGTTVLARPFEPSGGHRERHESRSVGEPAEATVRPASGPLPGPDGATFTARTDTTDRSRFSTRPMRGLGSRAFTGGTHAPHGSARELPRSGTEVPPKPSVCGTCLSPTMERWITMIRNEPKENGPRHRR